MNVESYRRLLVLSLYVALLFRVGVIILFLTLRGQPKPVQIRVWLASLRAKRSFPVQSPP